MRLGSIGLIIILAGCSSQETYHPPEYTQRVYVNEKPVGMDGTVVWEEDERSGAAYNKSAYRHVLGSRNSIELSDHAPETSLTLLNVEQTHLSDNGINTDIISNSVKHVTIKSYSVYETRRWERFCGAGKMGSLDWDFISMEGRENIPEHLQNNCTPPAFTRQEYIEAWNISCGKTPLTESQKVIRHSTLPPKGHCDE